MFAITYLSSSNVFPLPRERARERDGLSGKR
jgi:hypothetical protein